MRASYFDIGEWIHDLDNVTVYLGRQSGGGFILILEFHGRITGSRQTGKVSKPNRARRERKLVYQRAMKIYGIDFTSAPGLKKAITLARCRLTSVGLALESLSVLTSFADFEDFLHKPGPWVAGMDFPFGQPRKLIENIGWPDTWEGAIRHISGMSRSEFVHALETYCQSREKGDKHHLRTTDRLAGARSPMMLYRVPVGKMFFEGAPRLLEAEVSICPCRIRDDPRVALEVYPALVARRWIGSQSYKTDTVKQQTIDRRSAREEILSQLCSSESKTHFGFNVHLNKEDAERLIQDGSGDRLDALLCAVQAGWAYTQRERKFGIPMDCDPLEGWIVDPGLACVKFVGEASLRN
jgi:hypothetical protein